MITFNEGQVVGVLIVIGVLFVAVGWGWYFSRSWRILEQWATQHGFQILSSEFRILRRGSFFFSTSSGQTVYFVVVRDSEGHERAGYVRCGGFFVGLMSDKAEVRWVDE